MPTWTLILWLSGAMQPVSMPMDSLDACAKAAKPNLKVEWRADGLVSHADCISSAGEVYGIDALGQRFVKK